MLPPPPPSVQVRVRHETIISRGLMQSRIYFVLSGKVRCVGVWHMPIQPMPTCAPCTPTPLRLALVPGSATCLPS